jgi:hypothetical protein
MGSEIQQSLVRIASLPQSARERKGYLAYLGLGQVANAAVTRLLGGPSGLGFSHIIQDTAS